MAHVFTYGSLMFPEVWRSVVQESHASLPAALAGYVRHALKDRSYPGVVAACDTGSVPGVLYRDVSAAGLARLDAFEGGEYRRISVQVQVDGGARLLAAETYLYTGAKLLPGQAWFPERFDIAGFLRDNPPA